MDLSECLNAIEEKSNGCIMHIKVKIGKYISFPAGYDEWRNRIEMEINEIPLKGRANQKILETISKFFGIPKEDVLILYGEKNREKGIFLKIGKNELIKKLKDGL